MLKSFISYLSAQRVYTLLLQSELIKHDNNERSFMISNKTDKLCALTANIKKLYSPQAY